MDYINHLLNFLSLSIYLHLLLTINLFDHDPSHSPARSFFLFEHLHAAVSEMEHDDALDLGEVKLCWRVLIHLTISALQISGSFPISEGNGI